MRVIFGAAVAAVIVFHHVPGASAQATAAEASPPGWEKVVMRGTVSALMPPGAAKVTKLVPNEIDGGMIFFSGIAASEAGIEYRVVVAPPFKMRIMSSIDLQGIMVAAVTKGLGGPGRDVVAPAGVTRPAIEGWRDGPDKTIHFYRIFLDGDRMVLVSAEGTIHPGAETAIRRFANSVTLEQPRPPIPNLRLIEQLVQMPPPPTNPAGLAAATPALPSAPPASASDDRLSLIRKVMREYPGKNSGALRQFAGIYDLAKSCDAQSGLQDPSAVMKPVLLMGKQVIWFEGNVMVLVNFQKPDAVSRWQLTFQRDFPTDGGVVKIYEIADGNRPSQRIGFFNDMMMFDPTIKDNQLVYGFAKRCRNEAEMLEWVKKVTAFHD
jgi:hypothetical protein